jgi:hypothetical protein
LILLLHPPRHVSDLLLDPAETAPDRPQVRRYDNPRDRVGRYDERRRRQLLVRRKLVDRDELLVCRARRLVRGGRDRSHRGNDYRQQYEHDAPA